MSSRPVPVCHRCQRMACICPDPAHIVKVSRTPARSTDREVPFVGGPYDGQRRTYPTFLAMENEHWVIGSQERAAHYKAGGSTDTEPRYVLEREDDSLRYVWRAAKEQRNH